MLLGVPESRDVSWALALPTRMEGPSSAVAAGMGGPYCEPLMGVGPAATPDGGPAAGVGKSRRCAGPHTLHTHAYSGTG